MLFNSLAFAVFLVIVFTCYWLLKDKTPRFQNLLLLTASYFFYGCWDWRFLFLLAFSTILDYFTGLKIAGAKNITGKRIWFLISIIVNLGLLAAFKYYNFFALSFAGIMAQFGMQTSPVTLKVILPIAISFYTFHGLSYVIDIYKGRIVPERNLVDYSVFVCFFPLLVAGPIERATHLLPQIKTRRFFVYQKAVDGLRQILWGLFKKIVIADQCGQFVDMIFSNNSYSGSTLVVGALLFSFQIYGDFSGYSDIARGTARLFGIDVYKNFAFPYFSRNIAEFWRRWHISLTSWFRDYVYIPLGGSRKGKWKTIRNILIIFLLSGLWHGANWTFLAWGVLNALYFLPLLIGHKNREYLDNVAAGKYIPNLKDLVQMGSTFVLVMLGWIFFRADSVPHAFSYLSRMFSSSFFTIPEVRPSTTFLLIIIFLSVEWIGREHDYALAKIESLLKPPFRYAFYYTIVIMIFLFGTEGTQFIYFQF